jgi:hypothetical protein
LAIPILYGKNNFSFSYLFKNSILRNVLKIKSKTKMDQSFFYGFVVGYNFSRFTLSSLLMSGIALYMYDPTIYQYENLASIVETGLNFVQKLK